MILEEGACFFCMRNLARIQVHSHRINVHFHNMCTWGISMMGDFATLTKKRPRTNAMIFEDGANSLRQILHTHRHSHPVWKILHAYMHACMHIYRFTYRAEMECTKCRQDRQCECHQQGQEAAFRSVPHVFVFLKAQMQLFYRHSITTVLDPRIGLRCAGHAITSFRTHACSLLQLQA
jgi:hypothetical protein